MPSTEIVSKWTRHSPCPLARNLGTKIESHKVEEVLGSFYHPTCIFSSTQLYVDNGCKGDWCWAWNIVGIREIADESESGKGSQGRFGSQGSKRGRPCPGCLRGKAFGTLCLSMALSLTLLRLPKIPAFLVSGAISLGHPQKEQLMSCPQPQIYQSVSILLFSLLIFRGYIPRPLVDAWNGG